MSQDTIPERFRQRIQEAKEQQLEELDLSNDFFAEDSHKLTRIPPLVFELTHLKKLDLSNNNIQKIPLQISKLINLQSLDLIGNEELSEIPQQLIQLPSLTSLRLSWNVNTIIPEWFRRINQLGLHLINKAKSGNSRFIEKIPDAIINLENLVFLRIRIKFSESLISWLKTLEELELDLSNNQLTTLPDFIGTLSQLTTLDLSDNQLTKLPDSISNLSQLTTLDLKNNQLTNLPGSIGNLFDLTWLDLKDNQLTNLPDSIGNLFDLTWLSLSYNQLTNLPDSIGNLFDLTWLSLSYNQLTNLPDSIGNLSHLTTLYLLGTPLETPPLEVANKGIEAIKQYFRQLEEEGKEYLYEAKLLIVGEGGAGKTTLAKKIDDPNYDLDTNEKSTEGIDITKWSFPLDNEREFKVNIWDFGGQEIYHATHQFFLTKRSLYALLADTRKEDTDFYYWLNVVELLSNNSPLLIIKNEKQDRKREINERALRGQFTNLKETLATNLKTNRGLKSILTNIQDYIKKLPHIGQELPKTWVQVRKSLEEDERNYISLQEYLDICEDNGFTRLEDKLQLSGYLHDLGVCLHFQDEEDSLLYKTVILKPEWGTDAVYKVLDNQQVINNQGHFTRNDLKNIWHEEKYALMRGELIELMQKFQLCYEIPSEQNTFIAPQLLSENQPEYDWDDSHNLILRYTYEFMPKGILSRFIVIMHQYIYKQQYVWRSGLLLDKDKTLAEVIEYYDKREIKIRVSGKFKKDLLTIITHELNKIHTSYQRLKYQKLIPCNCQRCKSHPEPYFYPFDRLKQFLSDRQPTIQCQLSYQMVNVRGLIDDVIIWNDKSLLEEERPSQPSSSREVHIHVNQGDRTTDLSRNLSISGNAQVDASGAGALSLGDISGTVANTINQLPTSPDSDQPGIKELLSQLKDAIEAETGLDEADKSDALEEIQNLAEVSQEEDENTKKTKAGKSLRMLGRITKALPATAALMTIFKEVVPSISHFFGL